MSIAKRNSSDDNATDDDASWQEEKRSINYLEEKKYYANFR